MKKITFNNRPEKLDLLHTKLSEYEDYSYFDSDETKVEIYVDDATTQQIEDEILQLCSDIDTLEIVEVPRSATPRQMRTALVMSGIPLANIEAMLDSLEEPNKSIAKIAWEYSTEFLRDNELMDQLYPNLGLSSEDVDNLFSLAVTL